MSASRLILRLQLVATLMTDASLAAFAQRHELTWPSPVVILLIGSCFGQLAIISYWSVFARFNVALRGGVIVVGQWATAAVGAYFADGNLASWSMVSGCFATVSILVAVLLRGMGISPQRSPEHVIRSPTNDPADLIQRRNPRSGAPQYSLWEMLSLITAVGLMCGYWTRSDLDWKLAIPALLYFGFLALVAAICFASSLRGSWLLNGMLVILLLGIGQCWFRWLGHQGSPQLSLLMLIAFQQLLLLASGLVLRVAGISITRHRHHHPFGRFEESSSISEPARA